MSLGSTQLGRYKMMSNDMPNDKLLDLIYEVGSNVCTASRCFSLTEVKWC